MNYRQKKRIKDSAGMVKNVRDLRTNMDKLSTEYTKDLESFFSAFTNHFNKKETKSTKKSTRQGQGRLSKPKGDRKMSRGQGKH